MRPGMDQPPTVATAHRRVWFLRTGASTDGAVHEQRVEYRPDAPVARLHLHPSQDEHVEVEYGELQFIVDGDRRTVRAGRTIEVPRGTPHRARNASSSRVAIARWETRPALRTAEFLMAAARLGADMGPVAAATLAHEFRDVVCLTGPTRLVAPVVGRLAKLTGRRLPDLG